MEENEKPFGCVAEGCNMRFTNEDHLTVHKTKHDMILNLGQKMNVFVADQTPTPTRFIRNCEEVGLFQDLQNVNPFEETFRKAVEAGKSGLSLHEVDSLQAPARGDDTLHTPHVFPFPNMNDELSHYKANSSNQIDNSKDKNKCNNDSLLRCGSSDTDEPMQTSELYNGSSSSSSLLTIPVPNINNGGQISDTGTGMSDEENVDNGKETLNVAGKSMQLYLRMPDGKLLHLVQEKPSKPVAPTPTPSAATSAENGLALVKMKLKQALKKNGRIPSFDREQEVNAAVPSVALPPSSFPSSHIQQKGGSSCASGSGEDEDDKKLKFRERNRAAAMRCREKRKTWVQELERRAEEMQKTNQQLQTEVTSLRAEVAQLKTLLLAHKNCPITQAMNQAHITAVPIGSLQGSLVTLSHAPKRPIDSTPKIVPHKSIMVLKKPPKIRKTLASESKVSVSKSDKPPPALIPSTTAQKSAIWHKPEKVAIERMSGTISTVPVHGTTVPVQSVVVANPIVTAQALNTQSQLLVPFALSAIHPPPLVTFTNAAATATNENNLNLERMMNKSSFDDDSDDDIVEVPVIEPTSSLRINGSESKVIKVNPNAVRFNYSQRPVVGKSSKNVAQSNTNSDPSGEDLDYDSGSAECSIKSTNDR